MATEAGSPARAGIDRFLFGRPAAMEGFPRTRGDRPGRGAVEAICVEVPPHARG